MERMLTDRDVEAIAARVVALLDGRLSRQSCRAEGFEHLLSSTVVMRRLGYRSRSAFWQFVHSNGVPCVRLGLRRIVFDRRQLEDWLERRSTTPRRIW